MNCKYSYTIKADSYGRHYLYCNIDNSICPYIRYCTTIKDIKNTDRYRCDKKEKEMKNNVRFEKGGYLYIDLNDELGQVIKLKNPYESIPTNVELLVIKDEYFIN